ncbi:MAG: CvpA family protein [Acidobacteriota bacterium]|jgi:uncharacterized membrane protein required for colicin V production
MTIFDWIVMSVAAVLVLEGVFKGAVRLAFGLAGLLLGYLYAGRAAGALARAVPLLPQRVSHPLMTVLGFLAIFACLVIAGIVVHKLVKAAGLGLFNRLLGAVLGFLLACYLAAGLVVLAPGISSAFQHRVSESPVVRTLSACALFMDVLVPPRPMPRAIVPAPAPVHARPPGAESAPRHGVKTPS